jgi:hypothetical protein
VLLENVAYLLDDERRWQAFQALEAAVGTQPEQILSASDEVLTAVAGHGILLRGSATGPRIARCRPRFSRMWPTVSNGSSVPSSCCASMVRSCVGGRIRVATAVP